MQRIIFESSPFYLLLCLLLALGLAYLLYRTTHPWTKTWNRILFATRTVLAFLLMFLLLGPIVRQINNIYERPLFVMLFDTSASVREATDSTRLQAVDQQLTTLRTGLTDRGFDARVTDLAGEEIETPRYNATTTDLNGALKKIANRYEGRKIAGVLLVSDGIYNTGASPLYSTYNFPVHTLGVGDTLQRTDAGIKAVVYNKIAYQGNKFPLRVEVQLKNLDNQPIQVSLSQRGKVLAQETKNSGNSALLVYDFQPLANEQGIQKLDVQVEVKPGEHNIRNNRASVFVEVVEGKKKILVIAPAPHPDIKALREVIEKNSNYEFILQVPGLERQAAPYKPDDVDLVILHQAPDLRGKTRTLFQQFAARRTSLLLILGQQSDLRALAQQNMPIKFDAPPREYDEVTPVINAAFSNFSISAEATSLAADYPPVSVHFGKMRLPLSATPLLQQRVGNVSTEKPLLAVDQQDNRKIGVMLGEGLWRWRMNEFDRTDNTAGFDELFGKLVQFLSTTEDKRKFRSYPLQQEFSDTEAVVFESQVYNDIFEPVYGNTINIDITNEAGKKTSYSYVISPGNTRYQIGGLKEGVYRYTSSTSINQKTETVRGEFAVVARQAELQNLTADFDLLRKLSANTGGRFYPASQQATLATELLKPEAQSVIHTEESFDFLLNLKWFFLILILLVSLEWFVRKYFGSY